MKDTSYDIVAVGTGFATTFFLQEYLKNNPGVKRVLVLEGGPFISHAEQLKHRDLRWMIKRTWEMFINNTPEKLWNFFPAFGGGSNCWAACTPRLLPEDFRLHTTYGIGADWPISYEELEPYYCDAEDLMQISGNSEDTPYPRSRPYPQPGHAFTAPDVALKRAFPDQVFSHPCGRSPVAIPNQRPACCSNRVCKMCPSDAKFTVLNGMKEIYADPRIEVIYGAKVQSLVHTGNQVTDVVFLEGGTEQSVKGDLMILGANAMFNPHILLRSGLQHPELGRGLCEQVSRSAMIELDGMNNYKGTTISTALGYMCYGGSHRKDRAAALIQTDNRSELLNIRGRWHQTMKLNFIFEDLRLPGNRVEVSKTAPTKPEVTFEGRSEYTNRGIASMPEEVNRILATLPVKKIEIGEPWKADSHILGTTVMGNDSETSVVDRDCIHHQLRNLVVLGGGAFPTAAPANPTLTLCALALRSAARLRSSHSSTAHLTHSGSI